MSDDADNTCAELYPMYSLVRTISSILFNVVLASAGIKKKKFVLFGYILIELQHKIFPYSGIAVKPIMSTIKDKLFKLEV